MQIRTLEEAVSQYGREAYLLTIAKDGPHIGSRTVELRGDHIACGLGASAAKNIAREPNVSLFWPPSEPGGYSLIVNGSATSEQFATGEAMAAIVPTKSVLQRRGPKLDGSNGLEGSNGSCASDCRRLTAG